ncbi:alpha-N-arabinofuranosidase [Candidatus Bathyarchaeota archaeon]|nr:alpha-N-arabinofuranosidase [Candidatus Bathyarchaeota archaeon]
MFECKVFVDATSPIGTLDKRCYGQFIEHLGECIYGGIWVGEGSNVPNMKGYRLDVLEAVRQLNCPIVRWPGGNFVSGYHWLDGIGPRDQRPRRYDMAWGQDEPNTFGTDEFVEWCRLVGAEPYIVVNAGNGTPEEAAQWVEYCNSTKNTYFAQLRRKYGHEEPYRVKVWGIGNELYGRWQIGFCVDGAECARRTIEFAHEMRMVDPEIKLIAVGCEDPEWNISMVRHAGEYFDYLSIHIYIWGVNKSYRELVSYSVDIERRLRNIYDLIQSARRKYNIKREIKIAFDEWNVWYPEAKPPLLSQITSIKDAVFTAGVLNSLHRLCNEVPIAAFAQTVNVLPLIFASNDGRIVLTPQYLVFKMYGENTGDNVLPATSDSPLYKSSELNMYIPFLDISATLTKNGNTLYLHLVNRHESDAAHLQVSFRGYKPIKGCMQTVAGETVESKNTLEEPNAVRIEKGDVKVENDKVILELKPHSINIVKLEGEPTT